MSRRPTSVTRVAQLVWLLIAAALVLTVLSVVMEDELVRALDVAGTSADDTRVPPSFAPVAVVLFVTVSALLLVQLAFVLGAHHWARHSLAGTLALVALGTVSALVTGSVPWVALLGGVLTVVLEVLIIWLLYRPATAAWSVPVGAPAARS